MSNLTVRWQVSLYFIILILLAFSHHLQGRFFTIDLEAIIARPDNIQSITPVFVKEPCANPHSVVLANQSGISDHLLAVQPKAESEMLRPRLSEVWSVKSPGKLVGLAVAKDRALWAMDDGEVYMAEARTGNLQKALKLESGISWGPVSGKKGFWLSSENRLYCINSEGQVALDLTLTEILSQPPYNDNGCLLLVYKNSLEARDPDSGNSLWKYDLPVEASGSLISTPSYIFISITSGEVIQLSRKTGQKLAQYEFKMDIISMAVSEKRKLFVGSTSGHVLCFAFEKAKPKWQMDFGSQRIEHLLADGEQIYALTSGGLLYTLKQSGGDILWWQMVPGRTFFRPVLFQNEIIVPVSGKTIYGFNSTTGKKSSETELSFEIRTEPVVLGDLLIVGTYDYRQDYSLVYALKKEPQIIISPSRKSPQPAGQQITFTVLAAGFEKPKYEFYLRKPNGEERLVRKASKLNTWTWFPAEPGDYTIIARVFDKNLSKKIEFRYNIISFNL
ncbi:MAG: PQQ-binding-like beta-propeller repeat protein [Acidobacteriota bacterium]|nr:PQQ-binding-like beta-propeller repeat protein [Acidobacteriota bacterium]MDW3228669.1 PQQ-binding-like beta-propeller repeat protein [Acidobacteriota bacterium]MDY0231040.1 PQQ-binding-like beta-propeller repeat protein [Candidatus Saccharicenans sp.]